MLLTKVKVVHCDVNGEDFRYTLAGEVLENRQCDLENPVPNQEKLLKLYKSYCHKNSEKWGKLKNGRSPVNHLCIPSMDEDLGGSFDCSTWDAVMYNTVFCEGKCVVKYLDHVLLRNHRSERGRFWFMFGRSKPDSTTWLADTDWIILDFWSKTLLRYHSIIIYLMICNQLVYLVKLRFSSVDNFILFVWSGLASSMT